MRPTRQQTDEALLDVAAGVFARHGLSQAPVHAIATAAGYSKATILKRFGSKDALQDAVIAQAHANATAVLAVRTSLEAETGTKGEGADVEQLDTAVLRALLEMTRTHRGFVSLMLSAFSLTRAPDSIQRLQPAMRTLLAALGTDFDDDLDRRLRVTTALGGLSVAGLASVDFPAQESGPIIIAAARSALGHRIG